jgi:hypothetical protein
LKIPTIESKARARSIGYDIGTVLSVMFAIYVLVRIGLVISRQF